MTGEGDMSFFATSILPSPSSGKRVGMTPQRLQELDDVAFLGVGELGGTLGLLDVEVRHVFETLRREGTLKAPSLPTSSGPYPDRKAGEICLHLQIPGIRRSLPKKGGVQWSSVILP